MASYEDLKEKRVVVTGGAGGIGLATVHRFVKEGAKVVIFDLSENAIKEALEANKGIAGGVKVDVSNPREVENAFLKVDELMGGIDVLISNAGVSYRNSFLDISNEQWQKVVNVNLGGCFLCAQEAIKRMEKQHSGVVLFTASTNGITGHPFYADYNAAKAGIISLAKTIALEFAPWIRASVVCPGYVLTPMQKAEYTDEMLAEVNDTLPIKRHAEPEEIASLFVFLASSEAAYMTGHSIIIDGGEIV